MKFENIKVSDIVMQPITIGFSQWSSVKKTFFVARRVTKVTPKQFEVQGSHKKYRKKDGSCVGGSYSDIVYKEGEKYSSVWSNKTSTVEDQTQDAVKFKNYVTCYKKLQGIFSKSKLDADDLTEHGDFLVQTLEEFQRRFGNDKVV